MRPLNLESIPSLRHAVWARLLLGPRVLNGFAVGCGLGTLTVAMFVAFGTVASASASVGMLVTSIADQLTPARGKLRHMAPVLLLAAPFTLVVQLAQLVPVHGEWAIGAVVAIGGFIGMLGTAWGLRGGPLGFALVLAIIFALSTEPPSDARMIAAHLAWFELGSLAYAGWALASAWALNLRFRALALAEALNELATMLRRQGARLASTGDRRENPIGSLLGEQAVLADKLQIARDLVLDDPKSPAELRLAGQLVAAIRLREQALACELEVEMQPGRGVARPDVHQVEALEALWGEIGAHLDRVCWSLYTRGKLPPGFSASLETGSAGAERETPEALRPIVHAMLEETHSLLRLAEHGGDEPRLGLAQQARDWPKFRTPMRWSLAPLKRAMNGRSPVLRYAARVTVALVVGYVVAESLPWATHPHWVLLTIAVVMRTNIAQTIERRNARLVGTLLGCVLVTLLLSLHPSVPVQFAVLALGAGLAHGFALVRYLVAATAATVLALLQGQLLHTAGEFALLERIADTLIGTGIAWAFSYMLPAWERRQLPALLVRLRNAQLAHAKIALTGGDLAEGSAEWRLARREVHETLALIGTSAERALYEPRAVQPPLELLERVQLRSYRLLAQIGGLRASRESSSGGAAVAVEPLFPFYLTRLTAALRGAPDDDEVAPPANAGPVAALTEAPCDPEGREQLERRLDDAVGEARELARDIAAAEAWEAERLAARHPAGSVLGPRGG